MFLRRTSFSLLCIALTVVVLTRVGLSQQDDIKKRLATCASIKSDLERLVAYDKLAKDLGLIKSASVLTIQGTGQWSVQETKNPVDDSKTVALYLKATGGKSKSGEDIALIIRCLSNKTELYINWQDYLGMDQTTVTTRIGTDPAQKFSWGISTDYKSTFYSGSPISFIKALMKADKLIAQLTPYGESPVIATFDISGLTEAIKPLQSNCGWK